ncbi:MAG: c-type cytochrome [Alphaproteobacteria bacterium]
MRRFIYFLFIVGIAGAAVVCFAPNEIWQTPQIIAGARKDPARGEQIFLLAGCASCHTDTKENAPPLAGGRQLKTEFGVFVAPNITPDPATGIGKWTDIDFVRAMTQGLSPTGKHYYPSFPYTSYTRMPVQDILDLKAYLDTVKPVSNKTAAHELSFPYSIRYGVGFWKLAFFDNRRFVPAPGKPESLNRGAYLATGPGHCIECHSPRNFAGAIEKDRAFSGTKKAPEGGKVPNITPHPETGIGKWSESDMLEFLKSGLTPGGDITGGTMGEVIKNTSKWDEADRKAVVEYLRSLPPRALQ